MDRTLGMELRLMMERAESRALVASRPFRGPGMAMCVMNGAACLCSARLVAMMRSCRVMTATRLPHAWQNGVNTSSGGSHRTGIQLEWRGAPSGRRLTTFFFFFVFVFVFVFASVLLRFEPVICPRVCLWLWLWLWLCGVKGGGGGRGVGGTLELPEVASPLADGGGCGGGSSTRADAPSSVWVWPSPEEENVPPRDRTVRS